MEGEKVEEVLVNDTVVEAPEVEATPAEEEND